MDKGVNLTAGKKYIADGFTITKPVVCAVLAVICVLYIWHLGFYPLINPDEGRYAEIPREMLASGNFITPHLNGVEYFEKPALQYWITAVFMLIFGQNEFAARLFPALCALGGIFCTYYLGWKMFDRRTGFLAMMVVATSFLYFVIGSLNILDMAVSFFITLCMTAFYRFCVTGKKYFLYVFYASMALGLLTKGLIAIVLTVGIIAVYALCTKQLPLLFKLFSPVGIGIFLLISVPWFYLVCRDNPDFFYFFFIHEHFLRYLTTVHDRYQPFYFFVPCLILGLFPWVGFLFTSLPGRKMWQRLKNSTKCSEYIYLLVWFGIIFVFFSLSDSKLVPYIVPCFPPLAVLIATRLTSASDFKRPLIINAVMAFLLVTALAVTAWRNDFVSVREFILFGCPLIIILVFSNIFNLILWFKHKNASQVICMSIAAGILFCFSLQPIITEVAEHRSGKEMAQTVNLWKNPDTFIIGYQEYVQDLPFYTKSRVALYDCYDELKFGSEHESGRGWFWDKETLLNTWNSRDNIILVVPQKKRKDCFKTMNLDLTKLRHREFERYIVIMK